VAVLTVTIGGSTSTSTSASTSIRLRHRHYDCNYDFNYDFDFDVDFDIDIDIDFDFDFDFDFGFDFDFDFDFGSNPRLWTAPSGQDGTRQSTGSLTYSIQHRRPITLSVTASEDHDDNENKQSWQQKTATIVATTVNMTTRMAN